MDCKNIYIGSMTDSDYIKVEYSINLNWPRVWYCNTYGEAIKSLYPITAYNINIDESGIHTPFGVYDIILTASIYE